MEDQDGVRTLKIACGELLHLSRVRDLHALLKQALESAPAATIELDASRSDAIDASALQLMCAFIGDSASSGRTLSWLRPPQALLNPAQPLRLDGQLALLHPGCSDSGSPPGASSNSRARRHADD